ncbi:hypothetical protein [Nocardia sp. N2S4-5]|uniref:hypothetical protein n=1 Tax=Nocardia sp. N2S4-5 TaxID=3351565 RepID=UPI0037D37F50
MITDPIEVAQHLQEFEDRVDKADQRGELVIASGNLLLGPNELLLDGILVRYPGTIHEVMFTVFEPRVPGVLTIETRVNGQCVMASSFPDTRSLLLPTGSLVARFTAGVVVNAGDRLGWHVTEIRGYAPSGLTASWYGSRRNQGGSAA